MPAKASAGASAAQTDYALELLRREAAPAAPRASPEELLDFGLLVQLVTGLEAGADLAGAPEPALRLLAAVLAALRRPLAGARTAALRRLQVQDALARRPFERAAALRAAAMAGFAAFSVQVAGEAAPLACGPAGRFAGPLDGPLTLRVCAAVGGWAGGSGWSGDGGVGEAPVLVLRDLAGDVRAEVPMRAAEAASGAQRFPGHVVFEAAAALEAEPADGALFRRADGAYEAALGAELLAAGPAGPRLWAPRAFRVAFSVQDGPRGAPAPEDCVFFQYHDVA